MNRGVPGLALLVVLALGVLHAPGLFEGRVFFDEDTQLLFWNDRLRIRNLFSGREAWSWWDPLAFLGMPRLANYQQGLFSLESLYFAVLEPTTAWRFFPWLADLATLLSGYALFRTRLKPEAALFGSAFFVLSGNCQVYPGPNVRMSLIALMWTVNCSLRWLDSGQRRWLVGLAVSTLGMFTAAAATHLFINGLTLAVLVPALALATPRETRVRLMPGLLAGMGGVLLGAVLLVPLHDFGQHSSRPLFAGVGLSQAYRYTWSEALRVLAAESFLGGPVAMVHGRGYSLYSQLSLVLSLLAAYACWRRRLWALAAIAGVFWLMTLGEQGGLLWLLHQLVPATLQFRGPFRFIFPFGLMASYLAAHGWEQLRQDHPRPGLWLLPLWSMTVGLVLHLPRVHSSYVPPGWTTGVPLPQVAPGARLAVDFSRAPRPLPVWLGLPVTQGRAALVPAHVLSDGHYFLGLACSQWGERASEFFSQAAFSATPVSPVKADQPLLRSWGLEQVLRSSPQGFYWQQLAAAPLPRSLVEVVHCSSRAEECRWAASSQWDPLKVAAVSAPPPKLGSRPATIRVLLDSVDQQIYEVSGQASLLLGRDGWDPGWECRIDGRSVPTLRADLALKACYVPEGRHRVEWRFKERGWNRMMGLAGLGGLCWFLAGWSCRMAATRGQAELGESRQSG